MKYECSFAGVTLCSEPEKFYTRITVNGMSREFCGMPYLPINADEKKIKNISGVLELHKKSATVSCFATRSLTATRCISARLLIHRTEK